MGNKKFQNSIQKIAQETPPVWMMRQAGRYHPPYQEKRKDHSFIELCKNPKLAAAVAMDPIEDFDFDVAILFSDLLFPLEAMGMGLSYDPAPKLGWHLQDLDGVKKLETGSEALEKLAFQKEAVEETRKQLPDDKSLIGFVGSPWTLFVYAVAGSHKGHLIEVKNMFTEFQAFCEVFMPLLKKNIQLQLDGGAEAIMVFDTAAGELSPWDFKKYVEPHLVDLSQTFSNRLGYYSKNTTEGHLSGLWEKASFLGYGYDHRWNLKNCFSHSGGFTQGNFDQTLLFMEPSQFEKNLEHYLLEMKKLKPEERAGWVCGLGHGVLPKTPNENVRRFVTMVREVFNG